MIFLYRILFLPLLIISAPYYLYRMLKRGGYGRDWKHRFGNYTDSMPAKSNRKRIWLHAVSVGESLAVRPLIDELLNDPKIEIVLSTTTSTAYQMISSWKMNDRFSFCIFPIDFWLFSHRAWQRIQPDLVLLAEGELWGEHLYQAKKRNIPALLINARLSDRSYRRYKKLPLVRNFLLGGVSAIYCQSQQDEDRFKNLLKGTSTISTLGNLKLDVASTLLPAEEKEKLLRELGFVQQSKPLLILLGSSTWPGEEDLLLQHFNELRGNLSQQADLRLLLVPRHAERRNELIKILEGSGYPYQVRSLGEQASPETLVSLADTTGELGKLTQLADLVLIGKSFPPHTEGQTPVEAAKAGKAIICGPSMSNFRMIVESLHASKAIQKTDAQRLMPILSSLLSDPDMRSKLGQNALDWSKQHEGSTSRHAKKIRAILFA